MNATHCYVIRTLPVLFAVTSVDVRSEVRNEDKYSVNFSETSSPASRDTADCVLVIGGSPGLFNQKSSSKQKQKRA